MEKYIDRLKNAGFTRKSALYIIDCYMCCDDVDGLELFIGYMEARKRVPA